MTEQRQTRMPVGRMMGPAGARPTTVGAALTPKDILGILRRHVLLIISLTILGLITGGASWYLLRKYAPKYTAKTYIKVLSPIEKDPMVIGRGIASKDIQYGYRLSLAALMKQQRTMEDLLDRDKVSESKWFRRFGESRAVSIRKAVKDLRKHLGVSAERDAEFISVSMTCGDKVEAALIVNEMVSLFISSQGSTKRTEVTERLARLEDQRVRIQRDLTSAEDALDDVRKRWGFTDLERRGEHTILLELNRLQLEENDLLLEMRQIQTSIETLEKQAAGPINVQVEQQIERDPITLGLTQQIASQRVALAARLTKFGENHRTVREMRELISKTMEERQIRKVKIAEQTRQSNLRDAQDMQTMLQSRLEELVTMREAATAKKRDLDAARVQYEQRVSIRDEREKRLDETRATIETLKVIHDDPETAKVQFMGYAPAPLEVSSPKWQAYFPGGTMLGFMLGVGLTFLIELLNDLVRTPRDVGRYLNIPLLGVIPHAAEDGQLRGVDLCHVVRQAPYSMVSESYRRFRANLKLSGAGESSKALLVSSGMAGEGKTCLAVNLATTLVAENKKVLLIDANFWQPCLNEIFPRPQTQNDQDDEPSEFGLSTLLVGLCGYQEIIRPSGIGGFDIIDSGPLPTNPAELLGGAQMEQLLKHQRENYDYVIVDGPPVLLVSDTKVLAKLVDATILVFNASTTRRGAAQRTIRELREVNATIIGCVLLAVKAMKGGYFHEQFKSHQKYQKLQLAHSI